MEKNIKLNCNNVKLMNKTNNGNYSKISNLNEKYRKKISILHVLLLLSIINS